MMKALVKNLWGQRDNDDNESSIESVEVVDTGVVTIPVLFPKSRSRYCILYPYQYRISPDPCTQKKKKKKGNINALYLEFERMMLLVYAAC